MTKMTLYIITALTLFFSTQTLAEKMEFCAVNKISGEVWACWDFLNACEAMKGEYYIYVPRQKSE